MFPISLCPSETMTDNGGYWLEGGESVVPLEEGVQEAQVLVTLAHKLLHLQQTETSHRVVVLIGFYIHFSFEIIITVNFKVNKWHFNCLNVLDVSS